MYFRCVVLLLIHLVTLTCCPQGVSRLITYVSERYRSFANNPDATIAVVPSGEGRDYKADAQLLLAQRGLSLPSNLEPERFMGRSLKDLLDDEFVDFEVKTSQLTGKKKKNLGRGLFTKKELQPSSFFLDIFAWGELLHKDVTDRSLHPSDIDLGTSALDELVIRVSQNCPVRYINDMRGTRERANCVLVLCDIPDSFHELEMYGLVRLQVPSCFCFVPFRSFLFLFPFVFFLILCNWGFSSSVCVVVISVFAT